jgi:hypothetical protein
MSLANAQIWVRTALTSPSAKRDCLEFLDSAVAQDIQGFMMFGPIVMKKGRPCLAQWDGHELIRVDLSEYEQRAFEVPDAGIRKGLGLPGNHGRPPSPKYAISDVTFDSAPAHNGNRHLAGWCRIESPERSDDETGGRYVLEADYFRPDLPYPVRSYWSFGRPHYWGRENRVRFSFPPMYSKWIAPMHGPLIVHVQVCERPNPSAGVTGCWRVRNVTSGSVELT